MGIFARNKAYEQLSHRVGALYADVESLKSSNKRLELEWEELYDKVRHQMSRMSRRFSTEQKELGNGGEVLPAGDDAEELDPVSAKIHARRNRGRIRP